MRTDLEITVADCIADYLRSVVSDETQAVCPIVTFTDPMSVDAVLIYAQRGHGRRASVYSDYTFAVWNAPPGVEGRVLVPFAKAYSGLSDAEMARVDAIIRTTTVESFGPVRSVRPTLVFELGFEGIGRSPRHKSGIAVRFPRMLRWREDKPVEDADTLETLSALLPGDGA